MATRVALHGLLGLALTAAWAAPALGFGVETVIPFYPHGGNLYGSVGKPTPLGGTSLLVATTGPDLSAPSADDAILLVTDVGGTPQVTPLATPFLPDYSTYVVRVSATRAVAVGLGPDGLMSSMDDVVYLLDDLGGANTVTPIPVGYLEQYDQAKPTPLSPDVLVVSQYGADGLEHTADDTIALITDLGGSNTITPLPAPYLHWLYSGRPAPRSATSFLALSTGPDGTDRTADDRVYLFTDVGGTNARTDIPTPYTGTRRNSAVFLVDPDTAVLGHAGPDGTENTADDGLYRIDDLGGANAVTDIAIGALPTYGHNVVTLAPDLAVVASLGADDTYITADDAIVVITDFGGANTTTPVVVGGITDAASRPIPLSPDRVAFLAMGPDLTADTPDDELVVVSEVGGANTVTRITIGGAAEGVAGEVIPVSEDAVLVTHGGPDGDLQGGGDDAVILVEDLLGAATIQSIPLFGDLDNDYGTLFAPTPMGGGRYALVANGADSASYSADDVVQILAEVPDTRGLTLDKLTIKTGSTDTASLKGTLAQDGVQPLGSFDLVVSVGPVSQRIPAADFSVQAGRSVSYKDKKNVSGPVQQLKWSAKKESVKLKLRGSSTGLAGQDPGAIPVIFEWAGQLAAETVEGEPKGSKVTYKRPK